MLIEIHMIQNHSPSNLNRDDLGAPKTCVFGGVTRARISSQCLKRSIRNPGNPDDVHNREPGIFAEAMDDHIGARTKLFPWLVEKVLNEPDIENRLNATGGQDIEMQKNAIVAACKMIARAEDKRAPSKKEKEQKDKRPKTPQLIYLGPTQARDFVNALLTLRDNPETADCYQYFLDPATIFESLLEPELVRTTLTAEQREKALKAGWLIRITESRLTRLRELLPDLGGTEEFVDDTAKALDARQAVQPDDEEIASQIARGLAALAKSDEKEFGKVTSSRRAKGEPKPKGKREKPPRYDDDFVEPLKQITFKVSVDIALFGRMTTSDYIADVEAAMQVAHAFSTHGVVNEIDYFTAVDDLGKAGGGAGHVDEAMFNSACFYKYFCLDWNQLVDNLGGAVKLAACTLGHFLRAAAQTSPSGKQNSFASHCEPCGILVEIKKNGKVPTSYANAFAEPAERIGKPEDDGPDCVSLLGRSIAQFGDHVYNVRKAYGLDDSTILWHAVPRYRYPLQGWERENDGRKKQDDEGKELPPVQFANDCPEALGGEDGKPEGLVEAVIEALDLGFKWADVKDLGKASAKGA